MPAKYSYKEIVDSFYRNAYPEPNTGCWIWGASCNEFGYGVARFNINGIKFHLAHRFSYYHHLGVFDQKLSVCHLCDNPSCVNPDHLFLGTHEDNMRDMHKKGRSSDVNGELNPNAKIKIANVAAIRSSPLSAVQLSVIYKISSTQVYYIRNYKSWKGV